MGVGRSDPAATPPARQRRVSAGRGPDRFRDDPPAPEPATPARRAREAVEDAQEAQNAFHRVVARLPLSADERGRVTLAAVRWVLAEGERVLRQMRSTRRGAPPLLSSDPAAVRVGLDR